jgi:hypothetical protein
MNKQLLKKMMREILAEHLKIHIKLGHDDELEVEVYWEDDCLGEVEIDSDSCWIGSVTI